MTKTSERVKPGDSLRDDDSESALVDYLHGSLSHLRRKVTSEQLGRIRALYQRPACPQINYNELAEAFTYQYYLTNYVKNRSVFRKDLPPIAGSLVDLGAGSGASTLAYLSMLNRSAPRGHKVHVWLVDRSHKQLHLAKRILEGALPLLENVRVEAHYVVSDISDWDFDDRVDLVMASHLLTENHQDAGKILDRMIDLTVDDGRLYIIERSDDSIWDVIEADCDGLLPWGGENARHSRGGGEVGRLPIMSAGFLTCRLPRRRRLLEVVRGYFSAWSERDPAALSALFSPTAEYVVSPSKQPIIGLDEVITYWKTQVVPQEDPRPRILKSAYSDDAAFVEWASDFGLNGSSVSLSGGMVFELDHSTGLVQCLREWFRRIQSPRL